MRTLIAFFALLPAVALADKREIGQLVEDGVPEIPRRISERARPYENARGAQLLDWEPSGRGVLVATRFGETNQVHLVAAPGADRRQLTFFNEPVAGALYGPKRGAGGFFFHMDSGGGEFYQYYWYDLESGAATLLTDGKSRYEALLAGQRGGRLALVSNARNGADFDLYLMDETNPKTITLAKELQGQWSPVDWSADDARLLVRHYVSINESYLFAFDPISGALTPINESPGKKIAYGPAQFARKGNAIYYASDEDSEFLRLTQLDPATGKKTVLTPALNWDVDGLVVSPDGAWLAYTANEGGMSALYLARSSAPGRAERVRLPTGVISRLRFDRQSRRVGFTLSTAETPADVYSVDVKTRALTRWTTSEVGGLNPARFVSPERVKITSFDGRTFESWYYRARDKKPAPVIINIHGGPEAQATAAFSPTVQYWVNELGAAVLSPNVRGSNGYGRSFLLLDNGAKREDSVKDIGALLDWIAKQPELDSKRVAVTGGSYGGYMVLASLIHYPERLRCGAEIVGISNFVTFLEHTERYRRDLRRVEYGDERDPEMRKTLTAISPLTGARGIKPPLLVAQGANDPRVPASEAEQIVKAVRENKTPVWYLLAKDEGHGFQKKANRDHFNDAVSLFFEEYLLK
jgi:dipeptidyl aminopeptidase/acylaminoacyl peptidase